MFLKKHFICLMVLGSSSGQVMAAEVSSKLSPADALAKMIKEEVVFKIDKENEACPNIIQVKQFNGRGFVHGRKPDDGDVPFELDGFVEEGKDLDYDNFTHENNRFVFKPKLKGKSKNLSEGCSMSSMIACRSDYQNTKDDSIEFTAKARIYTLSGIMSMDNLVQVNPEKQQITYVFKANGIDDISCQYNVASSDLKNKVSKFTTRKKAERLAYEKELSMDDTNRSAVKEVEQRHPSSDSSAKKAQSK